MDLTGKIIINVYSALILIIILYQISNKNEEEASLTFKIYKKIIQMTIFILVIDVTGRLNGDNWGYSIINHISNFLVFSTNLVIPSLWLLYVNAHVYREKRNKSLYKYLIILNLLNALFAAISIKFGWLYYIDENNFYFRGPLYFLPVAISIALIIIPFIIVAINKSKIEENHYAALQYFSVPPLIGIILQSVYFNVSVALNSLVLSILLVFLNIQRRNLTTDYLTGVSNRSNFESALVNKISKANKEKTFSGIMIDINDFKSINDTFGHDTGDIALKDTARILVNSIRSNDLLARFGGDEFCVILDISEKKKLETIINRIKYTVDLYNETSGKAYKLEFSMGYAVYDYESKMNAEEFKKHIDNLMYEDKEFHRKK